MANFLVILVERYNIVTGSSGFSGEFLMVVTLTVEVDIILGGWLL
jgi:hypothetical protein